ncbi:hypothetical protein C9374_008232 [Naegleria lovaniensis]|uniref:Uncharacterized protein n=1 Tax=Naegleria lovaniensis TaxID=51637 RepID=A0AA88GLV9_NAELO|nr:uncharacterized protein C9374_008232 [Naegleria lovaniensis]KAG2378593.1 hypothetical protein C9374_008232 [Naegleria lovaniensis]
MKSSVLLVLMVAAAILLMNSYTQAALTRGEARSSAPSLLTPELKATCLRTIQQYDKCSFYTDCLEKIMPCGSSGYAINYGLKYCSAFFRSLQEGVYKSDYSKKWVASTGHCLQQALMDNVVSKISQGWTCERITDYAFNSHPGCYTDSVSPVDSQTYSICKIRNVFDVKNVLTTVDAKDLFSMRSMKQIMGVLKNCMIDVLPFDEVNELDQYIE